MAAFLNLAADPVQWNILQSRVQCAVTMEDALNRPMVNVLHWKKIAGTTTPNLEELANSMAANVLTAYNNALNARVIDIFCSIRPLDDPLVPEQAQSTGHGAGTVATDPLSQALAVVFPMLTGVRGRNFRGSIHVGGVNEADSDGGDELRAGALAGWNAIATGFLTSISDAGGNTYQLCVLSSTLSRVNDTPPTFTGATVVGMTANHILGTMRRRKERIPA